MPIFLIAWAPSLPICPRCFPQASMTLSMPRTMSCGLQPHTWNMPIRSVSWKTAKPLQEVAVGVVFLEFCKYTGNMQSYIDYRQPESGWCPQHLCSVLCDWMMS